LDEEKEFMTLIKKMSRAEVKRAMAVAKALMEGEE
jgi:hypothetical protein